MSATGKVILLVGASRGLGQRLAQAIATIQQPIHLIAASRSGATDESIKASFEGSTVEFYKVDYEKEASFEEVKTHVKTKYGHLDVLVNVGGVMLESVDMSTDNITVDTHIKTLQTNLRGPVQLTELLLPLIPDGGRVVYFSSVASKQFGDDTLVYKKDLLDPSLTLDGLFKFVDQYQDEASVGNYANGWPHAFVPIYSSSKGFLNLAVAIQARAHPRILINSVCPGAVKTDMAGDLPGMSVDAGIRVPLLLSVGYIGDVSGKFWAAPTPADEVHPGLVHDNWMGTVDFAHLSKA